MWPSVPIGVPKMMRYSVIDAWITYIVPKYKEAKTQIEIPSVRLYSVTSALIEFLPIAPPALLKNHSSCLGLICLVP